MIRSLRRSPVRMGVAVAAVSVLTVAGCGGEDPAPTSPVATGEVTATTTPPASPPVTDPGATSIAGAPTPSSVPGDARDDAGVRRWLLPVGVVLAAGAVLAIWLTARRRGDRDPDTSRQRRAIALAGWIHDQLSLEVLALPAVDAARRWDQERNRLDQLTIEARAFATVEDAAMWNRLVEVLQALATSIDVNLRLRSTAGTDDDLLRESVTIANRHRAELANWLTTATATI